MARTTLENLSVPYSLTMACALGASVLTRAFGATRVATPLMVLTASMAVVGLIASAAQGLFGFALALCNGREEQERGWSNLREATFLFGTSHVTIKVLGMTILAGALASAFA